MVVILVAYMPDFLEIDSNVRVSVVSGVVFNTNCISVNAIAAHIGLKRCKALFFALSFMLWLNFKLFSRQRNEILGCMAKEFSCFQSIVNKTVFKKFGGQKGCRKNCKCKKVEMMKCLPTCKCRGNVKKVNILLLCLKMLNKSCFSFEIQTYLKISIISYFRGPRIGIVIGKPYSKLTILRTLRKDFKGQKT